MASIVSLMGLLGRTTFRRLRTRVYESALVLLPNWWWRLLRRNARLHRRILASQDQRLRRRLETLGRTSATHPAICESVLEWSDGLGSPFQVLQEPLSFTYSLPNTLDPQFLAPYRAWLQVQSRRKYLVTLSGAQIVGENGLLILPDGKYAAESVYGRPVLEGLLDHWGPYASVRRRKRGVYFSLVNHWFTQARNNYYHWVHDTLLRLYLVIDQLPPETRFIVPENVAQFQYESLALLGIGRERLCCIPDDETWWLETLYYSPDSQHSGGGVPPVDRWFRERIYTQVGVTGQLPRRRVFISRRSMRSRRIVNEPEIEHFLTELGFEVCLPESLSVAEQVTLFSETELIVGVHGAALTNLLFMPSGSRVIEIMEPSFVHDTSMFWMMSQALGLGYWNFWGDSIPNPGNRPDIFVPLNRLTDVVRWALGTDDRR